MKKKLEAPTKAKKHYYLQSSFTWLFTTRNSRKEIVAKLKKEFGKNINLVTWEVLQGE